MMIPKQKPVKPMPLMLPTSVSVKPNSDRQLSRKPPRMAKPTPAARIAIKPPQRRRLALEAMGPPLASDLDMESRGERGVSRWRTLVGAVRKVREYNVAC